MPRQLIQQRVDLRLSQRQVLEEVHQQADFVERQADDIHLVGDGDDDFQSELAATQRAGDVALLTFRAAINFVGDERRPAAFGPPHGPRVREFAVAFGHAGRKDFLGPRGLGDLVRRGEASPPRRPASLAPLFSAGLLPFFFLPQRKRLIHLRRHPTPSLQLLDATLRFLQLPMRCHDQLDPPIDINPPQANVPLQFFQTIHATFIIDPSNSRSAGVHRLDSYEFSVALVE